MEEAQRSITELLQLQRQGDKGASAQLFERLYQPLRAMAAQRMRSEPTGHTLSATALVHEAYLKFVDTDLQLQDRSHFLAMAATIMRRILVDHARARCSEKRGGGVKLPLEENVLQVPDDDAAILAVDEALTGLAAMDERKARVVELLYFGGLTQDEAAAALEISPATVHRELRMAKAWLRHEMTHSPKS